MHCAPTNKLNGTVKALYSYEAQGADELSLQEGVTYELTPNGESYGDGWWEGVDSKGKKVSLWTVGFACNLLTRWVCCVGYFPE
jgi:hypothetical protein